MARRNNVSKSLELYWTKYANANFKVGNKVTTHLFKGLGVGEVLSIKKDMMEVQFESETMTLSAGFFKVI